MKKSDGEIHGKTASWGIMQSEWLRKCGRLLLLLLYRFVIGWAFFQLLAMIVAGIFLLGVLLFHPHNICTDYRNHRKVKSCFA